MSTSQSSGYNSVQWNATNNQGQPVSAGVYLYNIEEETLGRPRNDIIEIELSYCIIAHIQWFFVYTMIVRFTYASNWKSLNYIWICYVYSRSLYSFFQ